jgi:hypothetical protein
MLFCVILMFSFVYVFVPKVSAISSGSEGAVIYGSLHEQFSGTIYVESEYVTFDEPGAIEEVTSAVKEYYDDVGSIDAYNNYGPLTYKENILHYTEAMEANYDAISVLYIGHMHGGNTYWCGNGSSGSEFYDYYVSSNEIDALTTGKVFFAWSWTCFSAYSPYWGLPDAWNDGSLFT